jgi:putative ABC transport system substrate-binding protein
MKRRELITLLGGAAVPSFLWQFAAWAQQGPIPVIGYLSSLTQADSVHFDTAFRRGLSETGYVEGRNVSIEYRWITDRYNPLPAMAADLVQRNVTMIAALGPPAVLAAKAATSTIPIVFVTGADPIKFGFVASFNRPGGNITGIWMVSTVLAQKRLQLVRELLPKAELIALLVNPTSPVAEPQTRDARAAAEALGLKLIVLNAVTESDFDQVFATLIRQRADALFVSADPFLSSRREQLVALTVRHAIPTLYEIREFVEAGGLMSYGAVLSRPDPQGRQPCRVARRTGQQARTRDKSQDCEGARSRDPADAAGHGRRGDRMRRRELISALGAAALTWPLGARAQQSGMPVIGFLRPSSPESVMHLLPAFRAGLKEIGFVEGQNVAIEYRWPERQDDRLREIAAELVRRQMAVIVTPGSTAAALAAKAETTTIPIVFSIGTDPVKAGLIASLNRPGGNVTGIYQLSRTYLKIADCCRSDINVE